MDPKEIENLLKSVLGQPAKEVNQIRNEEDEHETIASSNAEGVVDERYASKIVSSIPDPLSGVYREDFVTLVNMAGLFLAAFTCLDHAFDPRKYTNEERKKGCLDSAEKLSSLAVEAMKKLHTIRFQVSAPNKRGAVEVNVDHKEPS